MATAATAARERRRGPILVVDDDILFREFVVTVLTRAAYRTVDAVTGEEALDVVERRPPEAAVLDFTFLLRETEPAARDRVDNELGV